jgi:hypothetical protein
MNRHDGLCGEALQLAKNVAAHEFSEWRGLVGDHKRPSQAELRTAVVEFIQAGRREGAGPITDNQIDENRFGFLAGGFELVLNEVETESERPPITDTTKRWQARSWLEARSKRLHEQSQEAFESWFASR